MEVHVDDLFSLFCFSQISESKGHCWGFENNTLQATVKRTTLASLQHFLTYADVCNHYGKCRYKMQTCSVTRKQLYGGTNTKPPAVFFVLKVEATDGVLR